MKRALFLLLLTGCDLAPKYVRPDAPLRESFKATNTATTVDGLAWRSVVDDPRLVQLIERALNENRSLRSTIATMRSLHGQYDAQHSSLFPTLTGNASASFSRNQNNSTVNGSYAANLAISSWELDLFGRIRNLSESALQDYLASEAGVRATRLTLVADIVTTWAGLAANTELLAVANDTQASAESSAALTRELKDVGLNDGLAVWQAETVVQQAKSDVASTTTSIAQSRNALELLVGGPIDDQLLPDSLVSVEAHIKKVSTDVPTSVLTGRPDVEQAEHQLLAANADIGAARAAFFPTVSLSGLVGLAATFFPALGTLNAITGSGSSALSVPIAGGARVGNLQTAENAKDAAIASYEYTVQSAFKEVADAIARADTIDAQRTAQQSLVKASSTSFELAETRYRAGLDTYLNALVSQRTWYAARQTAISTELAAVTNRITLWRTIGNDPSLN